MSTHTAAVLHADSGLSGSSTLELRIESVDTRPPRPGEAVVRLQTAALNHRDLWIQQGLYKNIQVPLVPGSDGAGSVVAVGSPADSAWIEPSASSAGAAEDATNTARLGSNRLRTLGAAIPQGQ